MELVPSLQSIKDLLQDVFLNIINVNKNIPRIENILFPELANDKSCLHCVTENDIIVADMIQTGIEIFEANTIGPVEYLKIYDDYKYILNGEASRSLDNFFATEPFPYLKDFAKKIERYEAIKRDIIFLRRLIPLNFICLECDDANDTLYTIVDDLRKRICNYFIEQNHNLNKG